MTHKQKFHPSYLKKIIEQIELISSDKLGIVLTQNNMGFCNLYFYRESFEIFDEATIERITSIFQYFENRITIYRNGKEYCGKDSSKRFILDFLNMHYLMYAGNSELKSLMNVTELIFSYHSSHITDTSLSKSEKTVILKSLSPKEYFQKVKTKKSRKTITILTQQLLNSETKKEYDFRSIMDFKKNFKPYKFTYD